MLKKIIYFILFSLLLADLGYSFAQYLGQPLDGDMAWNIVPASAVQPILERPFGLSAIFGDQVYVNPNRFFCHWMLKGYFDHVPVFLQSFANPVDSVYLASPIAKILVHALLVFLIAFAISGTYNFLKMDFIIAAFLISPLFQANGYRSHMGIIDPSVTYTFFYALPMGLLLLYLSPFILRNYYRPDLHYSLAIKILWIPFAVVLCLSGPLNPGILLIFSFLVVVKYLKDNFRFEQKRLVNDFMSTIRKLPKDYLFFLLPVVILSLYSLLLGRYNSNNVSVPFTELFTRLARGLTTQFSGKLGFPLLFLMLAVNTIIINKFYKTEEGRKILTVFTWTGIFAIVYILLLPFGGYRDYRPTILRYDTILPVTLSLIFVFGLTTLFILKNMGKRQKLFYIPVIALFLFIYTNADEPGFHKNACEKAALETISASKENIVRLHSDCTVLSWNKIAKPEDSALNAELLVRWGITKEKKLYYSD